MLTRRRKSVPAVLAAVWCLSVVTAAQAAGDAEPSPEEARAERVVPKEVAVDTNKDGKPDRWEYFENGRRVRIESDTNADGTVDDRVMVDDDKLLKAERDSDHDGKVDQWVTY